MMKPKPQAQVLMSKTLTETEPEYLETLPEIVQRFWHCDYKTYVTDAILDAEKQGIELPFEDAMAQGQAKFEAELAEGIALVVPRVNLPLRQGHAPIVYYMRMSELVKIGTTINLRARYEAIHPQGVMAVEYGSFDLERARHKQFVDLHSHGEWFHLMPDLVAHIFAVREQFRGLGGETTDAWIEAQLKSTWRTAPDTR